MEFTLYYQGPLYAVTRSNTRKDHKQDLRRHFHKQLKELWQQEPLTALRDHLDPKSKVGTIIRSVGAFQFAPLVCRYLTLVAEVRITLLRPEPPGRVITQSGDLDNRLKTLLDALKMPDQPAALPHDAAPSEDEAPFFCLLEGVMNFDSETIAWGYAESKALPKRRFRRRVGVCRPVSGARSRRCAPTHPRVARGLKRAQVDSTHWLCVALHAP